WAVGFLMALLTYLEGSRMTVVPPGTEARRDWRVEVEPGRVETREGPLLPGATPGPGPEQPRVWLASNPYLWPWFLLTLRVGFVSSNVPLRGLWEWIGVLLIALVITVLLMYGWWRHVLDWFGLLHIHINLAGYLFLSTWLFAIWVVTVFYFDTRTYIILSPG